MKKTKNRKTRESLKRHRESIRTLSQCAAISEECLPYYGGAAFIEECASLGNSFITKEIDNVIVGFAIFELRRNCIFIKGIGVQPGRNTHYIVREMLEGLLPIAAKHVVPVCTEVPKSNMSLYVALAMLGFTPAGIFSKKFNGVDTEFYGFIHSDE